MTMYVSRRCIRRKSRGHVGALLPAGPTLPGSQHYCLYDLKKSSAPLNITFLITKMWVLMLT